MAILNSLNKEELKTFAELLKNTAIISHPKYIYSETDEHTLQTPVTNSLTQNEEK